MPRDFDKEVQTLTSQIHQLNAGVQENLMLEEQLQQDADRLQAELGSPEVALDAKAFKRTNDAIEAALLKKAATARALTAISKAVSELEVQRRNVEAKKHRTRAMEFGVSALEVAHSLDEVTLPELKDSVKRLVDFSLACAACMGQAGQRDKVFDPRTELALSFAQVLRDVGLDVVAGPGITNMRGSTAGFPTIAEALAEFRAAIETPVR